MIRPYDILRRQSQADATAARAALPPLQPPAGEGPTLRWAKAVSKWYNHPDNGSYVLCDPCADVAGERVVEGASLRIYLPRSPGTDPNVVRQQVIGYVPAAGMLVAVAGYLDDAIGTVKMWCVPDDPPQGWTECIPQGTPGRAAPRCPTLAGSFPVGVDPADEDWFEVGAYGNLGIKTHGHPMCTGKGEYPEYETNIYTGTWGSIMIGNDPVNHMPPWTAIRFIERYDNSVTG